MILDVQLLERVLLKDFKTIDVEQANDVEVLRFVRSTKIDVDLGHQPVEHSLIQCLCQGIS